MERERLLISVLRSRPGRQRGARSLPLIAIAFGQGQVIAGRLTSKVGEHHTPETSIGDPALGGR